MYVFLGQPFLKQASKPTAINNVSHAPLHTIVVHMAVADLTAWRALYTV
jgi:hypothetical protein